MIRTTTSTTLKNYFKFRVKQEENHLNLTNDDIEDCQEKESNNNKDVITASNHSFCNNKRCKLEGEEKKYNTTDNIEEMLLNSTTYDEKGASGCKLRRRSFLNNAGPTVGFSTLSSSIRDKEVSLEHVKKHIDSKEDVHITSLGVKIQKQLQLTTSHNILSSFFNPSINNNSSSVTLPKPSVIVNTKLIKKQHVPLNRRQRPSRTSIQHCAKGAQPIDSFLPSNNNNSFSQDQSKSRSISTTTKKRVTLEPVIEQFPLSPREKSDATHSTDHQNDLPEHLIFSEDDICTLPLIQKEQQQNISCYTETTSSSDGVVEKQQHEALNKENTFISKTNGVEEATYIKPSVSQSTEIVKRKGSENQIASMMLVQDTNGSFMPSSNQEHIQQNHINNLSPLHEPFRNFNKDQQHAKESFTCYQDHTADASDMSAFLMLSETTTADTSVTSNEAKNCCDGLQSSITTTRIDNRLRTDEDDASMTDDYTMSNLLVFNQLHHFKEDALGLKQCKKQRTSTTSMMQDDEHDLGNHLKQVPMFGTVPSLSYDQEVLAAKGFKTSLMCDTAAYGNHWLLHHIQREHLFQPWQLTFSGKIEKLRLGVIAMYWASAKLHSISPATIHLAVSNFNRLLNSWTRECLEQPSANQWALTAMISYRLAFKMEERPEEFWDIHNFWDFFPIFTDWTLDRSDAVINTAEMEALNILGDSMDIPLSPMFLSLYLTAGGWPDDVAQDYRELAMYVLGLVTFASAKDHLLKNVVPSKMAAAALVLAIKIVNGDRALPCGVVPHLSRCPRSLTTSGISSSKRHLLGSSACTPKGQSCVCRYEFFPERFKVFCGLDLSDIQPIIRGLSCLLRSKPDETCVLTHFFPVWGEHDWQ